MLLCSLACAQLNLHFLTFNIYIAPGSLGNVTVSYQQACTLPTCSASAAVSSLLTAEEALPYNVIVMLCSWLISPM